MDVFWTWTNAVFLGIFNTFSLN